MEQPHPDQYNEVTQMADELIKKYMAIKGIEALQVALQICTLARQDRIMEIQMMQEVMPEGMQYPMSGLDPDREVCP